MLPLDNLKIPVTWKGLHVSTSRLRAIFNTEQKAEPTGPRSGETSGIGSFCSITDSLLWAGPRGLSGPEGSQSEASDAL